MRMLIKYSILLKINYKIDNIIIDIYIHSYNNFFYGGTKLVVMV